MWPLVLSVLISNSNASTVGQFQTWTESAGLLTQGAQSFGVIYDESCDLSNIYVIGGLPCQTCVYIYNIESDAVSPNESLAAGFWGVGDPIAVSINGTVYHTTRRGQIASYDMRTGAQTVLQNNSHIKAGCINKHPTKRELYIKGSTDDGDGTNSKTSEFYIYDIDSNMLTLSNNSLVYPRNFPLCVVFSCIQRVTLQFEGPKKFTTVSIFNFLIKLHLNENINTWLLLFFDFLKFIILKFKIKYKLIY